MQRQNLGAVNAMASSHLCFHLAVGTRSNYSEDVSDFVRMFTVKTKQNT